MAKKQEDPKKSVRSTGYKVPVKGTFAPATDISRRALIDKYKKLIDPGFSISSPNGKKNIDPGFNKNVPGNKNKNIDPGFSIKKKGGMVKAKNGVSTGPGFIDKVQLAAKRIGRNITNRRAVNLDNRSSNLYNTNREKSDNLYAKAQSLYDKASDKNNKIKAFKKSEGFKPGGDGTQTGGVSYKKPGKIFSNFKTGGSTSAFAKLAPPYNKETFADKIACAKKKKKK